MIIPVFDVSVTPLTSSEVVQLITTSHVATDPLLILNHNLHSVYVYWSDARFRDLYSRASVTVIDGWPILLMARLKMSNLSSKHRIGSTDWVLALLEQSHRSMKVVAVGGTPEASRGAAEMVRREFPLHEWRAYDGYEFTRRDQLPSGAGCLSADVYKADVVLVGMGMPRQELWIHQNWDLLSGSVVANVGGCFDYFAGCQDLAPRWLGTVGLEWAYRLMKSPRRLAHRYLIEPAQLLAILSRRKLTSRSIGGEP